MTRPKLSVGMLTADLGHLDDDLGRLGDGADYIHVDVMDGVFCPQLTLGAPIVAAIAAAGHAVDAHLMVRDPITILPEVVKAHPAIVTVHVEATRHIHETLRELTRLRGDEPIIRGIALNPGTPVGDVEPVLDLVDMVLVLAVNPGFPSQPPAANTPRRVARVRELAAADGFAPMVGVDGGVKLANAAQVAGWGPDLMVSGSAIFNGGDVAANLAAMVAEISK